MQILIINPANTPPTPLGILIEPIDTLLLATILKNAGHSVDVLDMDVKRLTSAPDINQYGLVVIVHDYHIPLHNESTYSSMQKILSDARDLNIQTVICGKFSTYANDSELLHLGADIYIKHDAETALLSIANKVSALSDIPNLRLRNGKTIQHNSITPNSTHLDSLPIPDRSLVTISDYIDVRTMLTSRGCHLRCKFCHVPGFWGRWRYRSADNVISEIKYLYETTKSTKILFLDDNALVNRKRMLDICEKLIALKLPITLGCLGSVDRVDDELLAVMYSAGFRWIHFGVESGSNKLLTDINKRINQLQIINALTLTKKHGFRTRVSVILDLPGSTSDTIHDTEDLLAMLDADEVRLHYLAIRMGSTYFQEAGAAEAAQYIHHNQPGAGLSSLPHEDLTSLTDAMIQSLIDSNDYTYVREMSEFDSLQTLTSRSSNLKLISQCPIRYGLAWTL